MSPVSRQGRDKLCWLQAALGLCRSWLQAGEVLERQEPAIREERLRGHRHRPRAQEGQDHVGGAGRLVARKHGREGRLAGGQVGRQAGGEAGR